MKTHFKASGIDYIFEVVRGNEMVFYLENGFVSEGFGNLLVDEFGYRLSATRTVTNISNPIAVFREVKRLVLSYVLDNKVKYFSFQGSPDRFSLYDKFAKHLRKYGFDYVFHEGRFTFFRRNLSCCL